MNALMSRINPATQKVLKSLGVNAIAKPTIREEGFTSCMPKENSHSNVTYMVCHYGGRMVSGYNIIKRKTYPDLIEVELDLEPHSVWETPEGELVDVTCKNDDLDSYYSECEYEFAVTDKGRTNVSIPMYSFMGTMRENKHTWSANPEHPMCKPRRFSSLSEYNTKWMIRAIKGQDEDTQSVSPLYYNHDINLSNVDKIDEIENARIVAF